MSNQIFSSILLSATEARNRTNTQNNKIYNDIQKFVEKEDIFGDINKEIKKSINLGLSSCIFVYPLIEKNSNIKPAELSKFLFMALTNKNFGCIDDTLVAINGYIKLHIYW